MNRLRDGAGGDRAAEPEIELLRGTPATRPSSEARRRVWNALQEQPERRAAGAFGMPIVRLAVVGLTLTALAGTVGAVMVKGGWIAPLFRRAAPAPAPDRSPSTDGLGPRRRAAATRISEPVVPPPAVSEPAPAPPAGIAAAAARAVVGTRARPAARTSPAPMVTGAQARAEVLDALVALRRDHEPARAGALLDRYLTTHARGALREEALALAIEAADARADHAGARRLALAYLAEYPRGRFRQFAQSHAGDGAPSAPPTD